MDMIERGGLAIQAAWDSGEHPAVNLPPIEFTKVEREYLFRAALKALREPTPAMIDRFVSRALQVSIHSEGGWSDYARNQWQAMIDGALAGEGKDR